MQPAMRCVGETRKSQEIRGTNNYTNNENENVLRNTPMRQRKLKKKFKKKKLKKKEYCDSKPIKNILLLYRAIIYYNDKK